MILKILHIQHNQIYADAKALDTDSYKAKLETFGKLETRYSLLNTRHLDYAKLFLYKHTDTELQFAKLCKSVKI